MVRIEIRFLTGRYHATPWDSHVNEGDVEWPPSPWRLLRALIATGYQKLGWTEIPDAGRELLESLAGTTPAYRLPPAVSAHTRHYMPIPKGRSESTTKVLDTFVHVGRDLPLGVAWPASLGESATQLLDQLLANLTYLGRAEGWASARRVQAWTDEGAVSCSTERPRELCTPRRLLMVDAADTYAAWRTAQVEHARERRLAELRALDEKKGKEPRSKLGKSDTQRIEASFPADLVEALQARTGDLRGAGWTQPPGTRWVTVWRPERAMRAAEPTMRHTAGQALPTMALLALYSDSKSGSTLPPTTDAVRRAEMLHDAIVRNAAKGAGPRALEVLTGTRDGEPLQEGHQHLHVLPMSLDDARGRRLDHVLLWAPAGFDDDAQDAILGVRRTYAKDLPPASVRCVGVSDGPVMASLVPVTRRSRHWRSLSPYVPARYLKRGGRNSLAGQIRHELISRGFSEPAEIQVAVRVTGRGDEWVDAATWRADQSPPLSSRFRHFRIERGKRWRSPRQRLRLDIRIGFSEPVEGPISLGYASHFGLGLFGPVQSPRQL